MPHASGDALYLTSGRVSVVSPPHSLSPGVFSRTAGYHRKLTIVNGRQRRLTLHQASGHEGTQLVSARRLREIVLNDLNPPVVHSSCVLTLGYTGKSLCWHRICLPLHLRACSPRSGGVLTAGRFAVSQRCEAVTRPLHVLVRRSPGVAAEACGRGRRPPT